MSAALQLHWSKNRKSEIVIKTKLKFYIVSLISDTINSIIDHVIWSSMEAGHVQLLRWLRSLWVEKHCQDKGYFIEVFYFKACAAPSVDTVRSTRTPRISARAVSPHPWIFHDLICYLKYFIWIQVPSTASWPACSPASPSCCSGRRPGRDTTSRWRQYYLYYLLHIYIQHCILLQGSTGSDAIASFCCGACVSCQTSVEIKERGDNN